jgi:hypothetical protein
MKFGRGKARPLPEILDGEDWEVRNSGDVKKAYVDFKNREFVVPFEESPAGEIVRAHEAMHIKITPNDFSKDEFSDEIQFVTMQSIEDCRVWQGLRLVGIPTDDPMAKLYSDKELDSIFETNEDIKHPQRLAEGLFALRGTNMENKWRELVREHDSTNQVEGIVEELAEKYFDSKERAGFGSSWQDTKDACEELRERIKVIEETPPPPDCGGRGDGKKGENMTAQWVPGGDGGHEELDAMTEEEAQEAEEMIGERITHGTVSRKQDEFSYRSKYNDPGKLRPIETPKFDGRIKFKMTDSVKMTPSDEGVIPTRMHRYATDMKVMSRKGRRRAGAAVLVDVSGSMSLSQDEVMNILKQCPAAIVAVYSGYNTDGTLRIIAENGRYYSGLNKGMPMSNIVDIPALEWLAKRKEKKKLWISDGWITCKNESMPYAEDLRKLSNLMRMSKIERVGNVREMLRSGKLIDHAFEDGHTIGRAYKKGQKGKTWDGIDERY